jgi:hypothetical protein
MDLCRLLNELAIAARKLGVEVRFEPFEQGLREARVPRGSSLCKVHGRRFILIDADAPVLDRVALLASTLSDLDVEAIYLSPVARATIGIYQRDPTRGSVVNRAPQPLARAKRQG